jgi:hypothetical protein
LGSAWIEFLLLEIEAVVAVKIANRAARLGDDVERGVRAAISELGGHEFDEAVALG